MKEISDNNAIAVAGIVIFACPFIDALLDGEITDWASLLSYYLVCGLCSGLSMWIIWFMSRLRRKLDGKDKDNQ